MVYGMSGHIGTLSDRVGELEARVVALEEKLDALETDKTLAQPDAEIEPVVKQEERPTRSASTGRYKTKPSQ